MEGAERHPEAEAFGGPIRARFEGRAPRGCGREDPPITTLDLGPADREADFVWGANFAVRRGAIERIGPFDEAIVRRTATRRTGWSGCAPPAGGSSTSPPPGWTTAARPTTRGCDRWRAPPTPRGRAARASDSRRGREPSLAGELRVLAGCGWHTLRRACPRA